MRPQRATTSVEDDSRQQDTRQQHQQATEMFFPATQHITPPPQPFYGPFSGTTQVSRCQKRTSGLYGARED